MVQASEQLVSTNAERYLLIYMVAVLVIVTGLVILFFIRVSDALMCEKCCPDVRIFNIGGQYIGATIPYMPPPSTIKGHHSLSLSLRLDRHQRS